MSAICSDSITRTMKLIDSADSIGALWSSCFGHLQCDNSSYERRTTDLLNALKISATWHDVDINTQAPYWIQVLTWYP